MFLTLFAKIKSSLILFELTESLCICSYPENVNISMPSAALAAVRSQAWFHAHCLSVPIVCGDFVVGLCFVMKPPYELINYVF